MKKVLMLFKSNIYAGAEKVAITIMQSLQEEYDFYYSSPYGEIAEKLAACQLKYIPLKAFRIREIRRVLCLIQPDIIHAHDFSASIAASLLKRFTGNQKLISHLHYNAKENRVWGKKAILYLAALRRIDCVISVSEAVAEEAVFRKALELKGKILGNPINQAEIKEMAERQEVLGLTEILERQKVSDLFEKAPILDEEYLFDVIFVGRLSKQKNPKKFIRILAKLNQSGRQVRAALLGEGELYSECVHFIQHYHLEQQVRMFGFVENPYPMIKKSKVLCMTSEEEGYGLAVAEAMVLGVPVLVAGIGGMKQLLGAEAEEFCKTEQEYVVKIIRLLEDPTFYQTVQIRMKEQAKKFPDLPEYMEQIRTIYKER